MQTRTYTTHKATKSRLAFLDEFGGTMPSKPQRVSDRNWSIFVDHVSNGQSFTALARKYGVYRTRTHMIVDQVLRQLRKEKVRDAEQ